MKRIFTLTFFLLLGAFARAQSTHNITGTIIDTTKQTVPGASVKLKTDLGDSTIRVTGIDGKFLFSNIKANKVTITITSIGYQGQIKHFNFANDGKPLELGSVILKSTSTVLAGVTIVGITPVTLKEDTTQYSAAAYKVRDNAPLEDLVKKLPGVDVDKDGNVTTKGKQVTKIRINGKDVFGGDLQSITKNLPADVVENIQMIDDYGDQANLTGIKTGDPTQVMNITIRKDKNYGYSANITGGGGQDGLPAPQTNDARYVGLINSFKFKGDQQIYFLGNVNNANLSTFSFGGAGGAGGGGQGGGGNRGGRGGGAAAVQNGITNVHTAGLNYRDQWGKYLSVYGSYSFADNSVNTLTGSNQQNFSALNPSATTDNSNQTDHNLNHRVTWNMEYKPDTLNYLKFTPTYSYSGTTTNFADESSTNYTNNTSANRHTTSTNYTNATSPNYGLNVLYNHRFNGHGRNFSTYINASSVTTNNYQNPITNYILGIPTVAPNQQITTNSRVNSISANLSYIEPLSKVSYLELNYNYSHSYTTSEKDTYDINGGTSAFDTGLSNGYNYTFTTNRLGLNYRFVEQKYNYTLGVGVQPSVLDGYSPLTSQTTRKTATNFVPTARYVYNFAKNSSLNINYSGSSNQPTFNQLQPVTDFTSPLYPVQGNPNLYAEFNNNIQARYNRFSFDTGDSFFFNFNFTQTDNKIVTNTVTYPSVYTPDTRFNNAILSQYLNADGYYTSTVGFNYAKPWAQRKYTLQVNGNLTYNNNIGYISSIAPTTYTETTEKNIGKNLVLTPGMNFRTDITDVIDARVTTTYSINKTDNSVQNSLTQASSNVRAWVVGLTGKNYFWKDWTLSYDYTKTFNYGYTIAVTNPNILNVYVERRFLKNNMATLRLAGNDLFNQNTGYSVTSSANAYTQTNVNRLGRYFLLTLNIRLQKFAGKAPTMDPGRDRQPGQGGRGPGGGGMGGPPGGGMGGPQE
jgi:hypothetical protein